MQTDPWLDADVAGYRITSPIGRGGMGVVYAAWDPTLKRHVAVKLVGPELSESPAFRDRFLAESELAASLEHPNVIPIHGAGEVDGQLYLVMRHVDGRDLKALLRAEAPLDPARAIAICAQLAAALDAAHGRGLVHRDVKPSNVLIDANEHVYLADFGLSRELADAASVAGDAHSVGTPAYVAPEQILGHESSGAADQYSLACVLYECLTGETPFPRDRELAVLFAHLDEPAPQASERLDTLEPAVDEVLRRALAKEPGERYPSCAALIDAARVALALDVPAPPSRRPLVLVAVAALALIAAIVAATILTRGGEVDPDLIGATDSVVRIDPARGEIASRFKVGPGVNGVASGLGYVWATSTGDSLVWRIDPETGAVRRIQGLVEPQGVVVAHMGGSSSEGAPTVIVAHMRGVGTIDAGPGTVSGPQDGRIDFVPLLAAGPLGPWAAGSGVVGRVHASGYEWAQIAGGISVQPAPEGDRQLSSFGGLAVGDHAVWASGGMLVHALFRVDPVTRTYRRTPLPAAGSAVAFGGGAVWVASPTEDVVWRVDPSTGRVTDTIEVGRAPVALAYRSGSLWAALSLDGTVQRIDPERGDVSATIDVGGVPSALAAVDDGIWVASRAP